MGRVVIKKTGQIQGHKCISKLLSHLKYVGFRSDELERPQPHSGREVTTERGFFSADKDHADYKNFVSRVENNKALNHPLAVKAHKLVFSMRGVDYRAYERSGLTYKDFLRNVLSEYERTRGLKLDWIANIHNKEGHPHVHVVIKAVSDLKVDGKNRRVFLYREDFKTLRDLGELEVDRHAKYKWYERTEVTKALNDVGKGFDAVLRTLTRDAEREQQEAEMQRLRSAKAQVQNNSEEKER